MAAQTGTRRERLRRATLEEIRTAARGLLTAQGSEAVTINAVAREVGMSGPALYHYFSSREALVSAVTADFFQELTERMETARDRHADGPPAPRLLAVCRAMRSWATEHPAEFGWIFTSPLPPSDRRQDSARHQAGQRFERVLLDQVAALWETRPFPVPGPEDLDPSLREQLAAYTKALDGRLPLEAVHVCLSCWARLYGLLCLEVLHQLDFAYTDMEPVFEECLREVCERLGLAYTR
ncbi:TetR/AcrR family transcriptional regulator [Streptomyces sp. NPDC048636]|uniref:TetR/AcrR family transcriptional regulator n=1 Tax=Streptomyces sp. NPDC048636 TaxID=3155762 RepID=UPI003422BD8D